MESARARGPHALRGGSRVPARSRRFLGAAGGDGRAGACAFAAPAATALRAGAGRAAPAAALRRRALPSARREPDRQTAGGAARRAGADQSRPLQRQARRSAPLGAGGRCLDEPFFHPRLRGLGIDAPLSRGARRCGRGPHDDAAQRDRPRRFPAASGAARGGAKAVGAPGGCVRGGRDRAADLSEKFCALSRGRGGRGGAASAGVFRDRRHGRG